MTMLDQVLLLEEKVESAVAKIQQLEAENAALRNKCSELTNALSSKTEQLTNFTSDQNKIESGIQKALDRLNSIENSVLKSDGQTVLNLNNKSINQQSTKQEENPENQEQEEKYSNPAVQVVQNFDDMSEINQETNPENQEEDNPQDDDLGFDIF